MSFIVQDEEVVKWPVTIHKPIDGGLTKTHEIMVDFLLLPDEDDARITAAKDRDTTDLDLLQAVVRGWADVKLEDGSEVPCNAETIKRVTTRTYVKTAFLTAYFQAKTGRAAQGKNS